MTRGFPSAIHLEVFPFADGPGPPSHHATRGFPSAAQPEVLPAPVAQSFLRHHVTRGFPSAAQQEVFPAPGGSELSSPHVARGFPSAMYLEVFPAPMARGSPCGFPPCRVAPGFPRDQRPQSLPNTGWPGVSPAPVARSFLLAGGAGLLLALRPGVALCRVARGFPFAAGMHGQNLAFGNGVMWAPRSPQPVLPAADHCSGAHPQSISDRSPLLDAAFHSPAARASLATGSRSQINAPGLHLRSDPEVSP